MKPLSQDEVEELRHFGVDASPRPSPEVCDEEWEEAQDASMRFIVSVILASLLAVVCAGLLGFFVGTLHGH